MPYFLSQLLKIKFLIIIGIIIVTSVIAIFAINFLNNQNMLVFLMNDGWIQTTVAADQEHFNYFKDKLWFN